MPKKHLHFTNQFKEKDNCFNNLEPYPNLFTSICLTKSLLPQQYLFVNNATLPKKMINGYSRLSDVCAYRNSYSILWCKKQTQNFVK